MADQNHTTRALIPFALRQIGSESVQTVDGRDLHAFLGIARDYATWVKTWIKKAHLVEDRDYVVFYARGENSKTSHENAVGGRPSTEYFLTFDAAKCLGMMSGSKKGDEVRTYFLECEKIAQGQATVPIVVNPANQALIDTIVRLDVVEQRAAAAEQAAQQAEKRAEHAETKADLLTQGQAWVTIHQYVILHSLERQMPQSLQQEYARYLIGYCAQNNLRVYPQPVAYQRWQDENSYYIEAIRATLPAWLNRRHAQQTLTDGASLTQDPGVVYVVGRRKEGRG